MLLQKILLIEEEINMSNKINIEDLPESQQVYVREYQRILHGLADVQDSIRDLERRAHNYTEELKTLRAKETAEFGKDTVL